MQHRNPPTYHIRRADWEQDGARLRLIRTQVFVREQQVPEALEWDGLDTEAVHLIAEAADGEVIGTARLLPSGQIGRMAVAADRRRTGVGRALLLQLLSIGDTEDYPPLFLNAQTSALPFYESLGFVAEDEPFLEAGIEHRRMRYLDRMRARRAEIDTLHLGHHAGLRRLRELELRRHAVARMLSQTRTELLILTADLEPSLYDQAPVIAAARRLAVDRAGHEPVRILLDDPETPIKRGHRIIELSRRFSSSIQIRCPPEDQLGNEPYLLADGLGCARRRAGTRDELAVDFHDPAHARQMRRTFERLWERSGAHPGLRRLFL
jgi:predicted GNAT family N-acyltransferase